MYLSEHEGGAPIWFSFEKDYSLLHQSTFCFLELWLEFIIIIMHTDVIVDREQLAVNVETGREGAV
jgi:hypothetical protein